MNLYKTIKDLKERNDSLAHQYRLRDIRCVHLEQENRQLKAINEEHRKINGKLREENKKQKEVIDKAIEYIEIHKRKDYFLELNEWGTRDLLEILKEVE